MAVLLDNMMERIDQLEKRVQTVTGNSSALNLVQGGSEVVVVGGNKGKTGLIEGIEQSAAHHEKQRSAKEVQNKAQQETPRPIEDNKFLNAKGMPIMASI